MAITVPQEVLEGIEEIRDSGVINMLDVNGVISVARARGLYATADWIQANRTAYFDGVFEDFVVEGA